MPEFEGLEAERARAMPEAERLRLEREAAAGGEVPFFYPLEGRDLIQEIQRVEIKRLPQIAEEALAFREGLKFGLIDYDLNNPETLLDLQNLFTSVEGGTERPSPWYLDAALVERTSSEIRKIKGQARKEKRGLNEAEKKSIAQLMRIENQRKGRKAIDEAFVQRMLACEQWEAVAALLSKDPNYRPSVTPDKGHWQGAFQGEFGVKVDKVLREIVRMGMSPEELRKVGLSPVENIKDTVYATNFRGKETFRIWLSHLLEVADDRMDVVWFAWRLALLWEISAQLGAKDIKGKIQIADPPIGNDLHTWTTHLEKKRALEWGLDASDKRVRESKYLTHTGYPLSLGKIYNIRRDKDGVLCESYLHEATVFFPPGSEKRISLWELWWKKGMKLGGDFERDRDILPWTLIELQPRGLDTEELPPGSFGFWYLTRFRASKVLQDIRSRPGLRDLSDPDFFASRLRNWEKVLGVPKPDWSPEKNPRTWWVAGLIMAHHLQPTNKIPLVKEDSEELAYRTYSPGEVWSPAEKGMPGSRPPSIWEVLNHAYQCGFLRKKDIDWLITKLGLPKPPLGASPY